jgi:DNA-binding transcriptional ArsR family regulator
MPDEPSRGNLDFERLSTYLKALSNPNRLELLWLLRIPTSIADLHLTPKRKEEGLSATRPMSRQAVAEHIEGLEAVGVIERLPETEGKAGLHVVHQARLFALLEEMRTLTAIRPSVRVDVNATMDSQAATAPDWVAGPKLVLVSGPWEGRVFALAGSGPWTLGRAGDAHVALTYDPYASSEQARITRSGAVFALEPALSGRNPARVNFAPLVAGKTRALRSGDVVGVGRSLLVFQDL